MNVPRQLEVYPDAQALARAAADHVAALVRARPALTVLVATGHTPEATYAELARRVGAGELDLGQVTAVQLDEYLDLEPHDPRRLWNWMERSFVTPLRVTRSVRFDVGASPPQACARYDRAVRALGGVDLAVLGLGPNGHLGFNEPPSGPRAPTRPVTLSAHSLDSNRAYWGRDVPARALTAGMTQILAARRALLLVTGAHKHGVLQRLLTGPETPDLPASLLSGPQVTVLADRAALDGDGALPTRAGPLG